MTSPGVRLGQVMGFLVSVFVLIGYGLRAIWMVPWRWWRFVLASRRDVLAEDPPLAVLMRVRNYLGLAVVIGAHVNWRWGRIDGGEIANGWMLDSGWLIVVLMTAITAVCVLFVACARRGQRIAMTARMSIPVWTIGMTLAIVWIGGFVDEALDMLLPTMAAWGWWDWLASLVWLSAGLVVILLLVTFIAAYLVLGVSDFFRAPDAHPMMMPILALVLCGWTLADGLGQYVSGDADPLFPWWATLLLTVGGPLSVGALSVVQFVRQREVLGIEFRRVSGESESRIARIVGTTLRQFTRTAR
ncbi:hypothetical protein ACFM35_02280 [Microbacterium sp. P01]|uniref:hypothetical protein n=1 Tax=Microbacterium sp. P01 TaxID=3366261 RepID=UPI00366C4A5C